MKFTKNKIAYGFLFVFFCMFIAGIILSKKTSKEDPNKTDRSKETDRKVGEYLSIIGLLGVICVVLYIMLKKEYKYTRHSMKPMSNIGFKFY
jgi:archaellum biogenesis protein FlaJ (TadC family)